ncbi:MAG: ATP-binding protein [Parvularcula sp.]|nr:ATP-binding protein [Parvularcula sp.]
MKEYIGNRYIDALPPVMSRTEWTHYLDSLPECNEDERDLPPTERFQRALRILRFFRAGQREANFARGLDAMIREGYIGRSDDFRAHEARMHAVASARESGTLLEPGAPLVIRNATSSALLGVPGMGKTATVERVLSRYPQVKNHPDGQVQIVWLKLECPAMGSIRQTCRDFFKSVDALVGGNKYDELYCAHNKSEDDLMEGMVAVANLHSLGVLVIDEIQHLGKAGDEEHRLMTFLTTLINKIGVPVLFVGTMSAFERLSRTVRIGRRAVGPASAIWENFAFEDPQWRHFIKKLWEYQWTSEFTPPTEEMLKLLHDRSGGVIDIVLKLWFAIQITIIDQGEIRGGRWREAIDEDVINRVADRHLKPMQGFLDAVRSGDPRRLREFDDAAPRNQEFARSIAEIDGPTVGDLPIETLAGDRTKNGPAYIGQCASVVRENLEQRFRADEIAELMRRASERLAPPSTENLGIYFRVLEEVISEYKLSPTKKARARPVTADEERATFVKGDLRAASSEALKQSP